jgi:hypothetical protein
MSWLPVRAAVTAMPGSWLTTDNKAKASFGQFIGSPGYDAADLCTDIERLSFLLGGNDGEHLLA